MIYVFLKHGTLKQGTLRLKLHKFIESKKMN